MKRFSYLSLFGIVLAGCSAPATQSSNAAPTDAPVVNDAATPVTPLTSATPNSATSNSATSNSAAPKSTAPKPAASKPAASKPASSKPVAKPAAPKAAAAPDAAPTKSYVVQKVDPQMGPQFSAAMAKVIVTPPSLKTPLADKPRLVLSTTKGPITVELDTKAAPLQVRSFVYLSGKGFFDKTVFHRHADLTGDGNGFIIQGGDPLTKDPANAQFFGQGGPGYTIPHEYNALKHDKLVIAAARANDPDSAGSQFYITQGPVHFLDDGYTVFGKVVAGQDAALKLTQGDVIKNITVEKK